MSPSLSTVNVSFLCYCSSPSFVYYVFSKYLGVIAKVQGILPGPGNSKVKDIIFTPKELTLTGDMGNKHIVVCGYIKEVTTSQLVGGRGQIKVSLNKTENL